MTQIRHFDFPYFLKDSTNKIAFNNTFLNFNDDHSPFNCFIQLEENASNIDAYKTFFETISILSLYTLIGTDRRKDGAIGGVESYESNPSNNFPNNIPDDVNETLILLKKCSNPFQIQAGINISRAYYYYNCPEISLLEFFKIIELAIKYYSYQSKLSAASVSAVQRSSLFHTNIKDDLISKLGFHEDTIDLVWNIKDIRNRLIGHGGVRPEISNYFGDPERNNKTLDVILKKYNSFLQYDSTFFEYLFYDMEILSRLFFCKICNIPPFLIAVPGCWNQPSDRIRSVIEYEKINLIDYQFVKTYLDSFHIK